MMTDIRHTVVIIMMIVACWVSVMSMSETLSSPPENWTVREFLQLTPCLSNDFTAAWLTFTFPQLFASAATLKSIDYNVAMTFILNNNNMKWDISMASWGTLNWSQLNGYCSGLSLRTSLWYLLQMTMWVICGVMVLARTSPNTRPVFQNKMVKISCVCRLHNVERYTF